MMIAAVRSAMRVAIKPAFAVARMASEQPTKPEQPHKVSILNRIPWPKKSVEKEPTPTSSILDVADFFKSINYRHEFPQNLTAEQKKSMKRFDIFR